MMSEEKIFERAVSILAEGHTVFCPSMGEYPVYDDMLYDMMSNAPDKIEAYRNAVEKNVKGKTVVEIGTGSRAVLALLCAKEGAKKVYAFEGNREAAEKAVQLVADKGFDNVIQIIPSYSDDAELPEKADICVSEIIGNIGSSEGAIKILHDAKRFLKEDGYFIPELCITKMAPVSMPERIYNDEFIQDLLDKYTNKVYKALGYEFPFTRFAVFNFPESSIIADAQVFEKIDFNNVSATGMDQTIEFHIDKERNFNGFLLWVELHVNRANVINTLRSLSWAPVYINAGNIELERGDVIKVNCSRRLSRNLVNPDYFFDISLMKSGIVKENIVIKSYHTLE